MAGINLAQLNEGQRSVVSRLDEPLFVAAGAGSGKTFTLTARLVHALSPGSAADGGRYLSSIDEALVITFTEAAALEIKERVRQSLRSAGELDPLLREESLKVDGAWISTIHGMCSRILHRHAIELGIDPKFSVCVGSMADTLWARALDETMAEVQRDDAYEALRAEYPLWGSSAGSVVGMIEQLRTEAAKCVHGFDDMVCPQSHEAPAELDRLRRALESIGAEKLTARQQEVLDASLAPLDEFSNLAPGARTAAAACAALEQVTVPDLRRKDIKYLKDEAKQVLAEAMVCAQYERVQELLPQLIGLARIVSERYAARKLELSYLDNDDLISLALAAVEGNPEVARDYAGRFRLVMIDEFQDTDEKQLRLISLLSGKDARHLATVGDAQQSIYRFRGGDVEVFRARGRMLPTSSHVAMDVNYRSDHNVLALVERVCGDAGLLGDFLKLACDAGRRDHYEAHEADGSESPRIRLEVASGGTAEVMSATLAAQIADRLALWRDAGQPVGSMALLLGATTKVGLYLDALRARGLPAVVTGGSSFSTTPEVGVIQALLHTLANPHDTETGLFRLLSSDMFRLDADDFCQLGTRTQTQLDAPTKRTVEQCFVNGELVLYGDTTPSPRLIKAHEVLSRAFERMGRWQLADVCQAVVEESGWLARLEGRGIDGLAVAANVLAAIRYVRDLTEDLQLGVARAAEEFDLWLAAAKLTPANLVGDEVDAVRVMTVHGSKGLQFAVTAVAECWGRPAVGGRLSVGRIDGRCVLCLQPTTDVRGFSGMRSQLEVPEDPSGCETVSEWAVYLNARELDAQAAEKARLLYVALTRAEEALVVGVPVSDREHLQSPLGMAMLSAFEDLDASEAGEHAIDISPARPIEAEERIVVGDDSLGTRRVPTSEPAGIARVVRLERENKDAPWTAHSDGTLQGFDGELPESVSLIPLLGASSDLPGSLEGQTFGTDTFWIYDMEVPKLTVQGWFAREGIFSYSSARAQVAAEQYREELQNRDITRGMREGLEASGASKRVSLPTPAQQEAEAEGAAFTDDVDRATSLGSAFHELAQTMVEARCDHDPVRLEALARTWRLSERQIERLRKAVARWEASELRREAWAYELVRAEVPFFCRVDTRFGEYVEGAIDLLSCDRGGTKALVVDYKTGDVGLSVDEVRERHEMQANFYAWVLCEQGFEQVECAFCCVEVDDPKNPSQPLVVRYAFDGDNPPHLE